MGRLPEAGRGRKTSLEDPLRVATRRFRGARPDGRSKDGGYPPPWSAPIPETGRAAEWGRRPRASHVKSNRLLWSFVEARTEGATCMRIPSHLLDPPSDLSPP